MTKQKDIAKIAGVNISTVSKALRNSPDINKETTEKIKDIAKRMGYETKNKDTEEVVKKIGIICPEVRSNYYAQILTEMQSIINEKDAYLFLSLTSFSYEREIKSIESMIEQKVDGIVCMTEGKKLGKYLESNLANIGIPIVQVAITNTTEFDSISVDYGTGIDYAIGYLYDLGHRKIAFLGDQYSTERLDCFKESLKKREIPLEEEYIQLSTERFENCGYELMDKLLELSDPPTAILGEYDDIVIGAMCKAREKGINIPDDMSFIGIDNVSYAYYLNPALTTVGGDVKEMSSIALALLFKKMKNKSYNLMQHVQIKPELIIRESAGKFRK